LVASSGPLLRTAIVNVTVSPTFGAVLFTDFTTWMSADAPLIVTPEESLVGSGSVWFSAVFLAMLTIGPGTLPSTVAAMASVTVLPLAMLPMVHTPEAEL
jgi:hypothetical protein